MTNQPTATTATTHIHQGKHCLLYTLNGIKHATAMASPFDDSYRIVSECETFKVIVNAGTVERKFEADKVLPTFYAC